MAVLDLQDLCSCGMKYLKFSHFKPPPQKKSVIILLFQNLILRYHIYCQGIRTLHLDLLVLFFFFYLITSLILLAILIIIFLQ